MRRTHSRFRLGLAAVLAVVLTLLSPHPALAAIIMTDGTVYTNTGHTDYQFTTDYYGWSAVALFSPVDYHLNLFQGTTGTAYLASSTTYAPGRTEFIAINSRYRPLSPYRAEAIRYIGTGPAYVEWDQAKHHKVVLPYPANDGVTGPGDPDLAYVSLSTSQVINLYTIELAAGDAFWARSHPDTRIFFLESNPYHATQIVTRKDVARAGMLYMTDNCTLYRATRSGQHALVIVTDFEPFTTTPAEGVAVPLHRFDPARPYTCPQNNFPEYTPPGP